LQSFSKNLTIDFRRIPILIESNNEASLEVLKSFAASISDAVVPMSEADRVHIHIAGVMVNNFTNHLFSLSDKYLSDHQMDFNMLKPLIAQTIEKLNYGRPAQMQTGPAIREDKVTIEQHKKMLDIYDEKLSNMYDIMTQSIIHSNK
jgi:predicted short-subunit dehydrogenase-like oxidoreductase (DUF2520 family)